MARSGLGARVSTTFGTLRRERRVAHAYMQVSERAESDMTGRGYAWSKRGSDGQRWLAQWNQFSKPDGASGIGAYVSSAGDGGWHSARNRSWSVSLIGNVVSGADTATSLVHGAPLRRYARTEGRSAPRRTQR